MVQRVGRRRGLPANGGGRVLADRGGNCTNPQGQVSGVKCRVIGIRWSVSFVASVIGMGESVDRQKSSGIEYGCSILLG